MSKRIGVIGSGRFGEAVIQSLCELGAEILLMDIDRERVQTLSEYVAEAQQGDATNIHTLEDAGFATCETVIVAIGENIEGSVMATVNCKDLGVKTVVAKATTDAHGKVLRRVGADVVIFPNRDRAHRLARTIMTSSQIEFFDIGDGLSASEIRAPECLHGKSLSQVDVRKTYDVTVLAVRRSDKENPSTPLQLIIPSPDETIRSDDRLIVFGDPKKITTFSES